MNAESNKEVGLVVEHRRDGQLWAEDGARRSPVWVRRCFPWSEPTRFVSLRDHDENEFALVTDVRDLDDASRAAVEGALAVAGFVLEIESVIEVKDEVEIRSWQVGTTQGERSFQTRLDEWPWEVPGGGFVNSGRCRRPVPRAGPGGLGRAEPSVALGFRGIDPIR